MRRLLTSAALLAVILAGAPLHAQNTKTAGSTGLTISGFISGTMYVQNQYFGLFSQGQAANTASVELDTDNWFHGGDVRNSRLSLGFTREAAEGSGWSTAARLELDLFGGWAGNEPFGDEQPIPRLRLAYADITNGTTTFRIGQAWAPMLGNVPNSLSHIAFPLGYGSGGVIGWRFPGIFVYHDLAEGDTPVELQLAAMGGSWSHVIESSPDDPSPGEAAMFPQLEARLNISGTAGEMPWNAYFVGHVDRKDMDGVGVDSDVDDLTGTALEAGARIRPGPVTLQGNVYYGQAIGQLLGSITQLGDYEGLGGWVQAGYQFDPRWSLWGFVGMDDARDGGATLPDGARDENQILAAMLRYDLSGYAIGLEWLRANTDFVGATESSSATQLALSVFYAF